MQYQHVHRTPSLLAEALAAASRRHRLRPPRHNPGVAASRCDRSWHDALHGRQHHIPVLLMSGLLGISAAFTVGMVIASRDALRQHIVDDGAAATMPAPLPPVATPGSTPPPGAEAQSAAMPAAPPASTLATSMPQHPAAQKTAIAAAARPRGQRATSAARPDTRSAAKVAGGPTSAERLMAPTGKAGHAAAAQYAQCTRLESFLAREKCKWRVCGGKWGAQGCPAYQHSPPPGVGIGMGMSAFPAPTNG